MNDGVVETQLSILSLLSSFFSSIDFYNVLGAGKES